MTTNLQRIKENLEVFIDLNAVFPDSRLCAQLLSLITIQIEVEIKSDNYNIPQIHELLTFCHHHKLPECVVPLTILMTKAVETVTKDNLKLLSYPTTENYAERFDSFPPKLSKKEK
jgi:hypothetical protein